MEPGLNLRACLKKAFEMEGTAGAEAAMGRFREGVPGRDEKLGCSAEAPFPLPCSLGSFPHSLGSPQ